MRHALLSALLAPALLFAGELHAADLPRGARAPVDNYYAPPSPFSWQGFYVGVNAGYAFSSFRDGGHDLFGEPDGGLIGVTAGYNFALASNFVAGLEGDFDFAGMKGSRTPWIGISGRSSVDNILTLRARAGVTFDRALVFITAGFAGLSTEAAVANAYLPFFGRQSKFQTGWALGGGVEFAVTNNISAKAEYIFTSVGGDHYFDFGPLPLLSSVDTSTVKAGLNYHF